MKRLVVIGAGISGLAAARTAVDAGGAELEVVVLEKDSEPGGKARTRHRDGWAVETGPAAYLSGDAELEDLVRSTGLEPRAADPASANRFIVRGGRLRAVSPHPLKMARSGLLGPLGMARILREPFVGRATREETVWEFAARRLGPQVADRLVSPMVLGVFAGDAKKVSLPAAFPRLAALESEHGSLIRGMMKRRREGAGTGGGPAGPAGTLSSFERGIQQLPLELAADPRLSVRCDREVLAIGSRETGWRLRIAGEEPPLDADAVVLAGEAHATAGLFDDRDDGWLRRLREIPYPPVAIVALGLPAASRGRVPRGFGALIPRSEGLRMLGVLFDGYIFDGRCPEGTLLVRAFLGGAVDPEVTRRDDEELVTLVRRELRALLGVEEEPVFSEVVRWERAIPQYEIGHPARVAAIEEEVARIPGLFLAGNALHGIAFGKAAAAGVRAGAAAADYLRGS